MWAVCGLLAGLALGLGALLQRFCFPLLWLDLGNFCQTLRLVARVHSYSRKNPPLTLIDLFLQQVARTPDKTFVIFQGRSFSYRAADKLSNKAARALQATGGLKEGDCVALFVDNQPLFLWLWLGLAKLGCAAAFLNYNIRGNSLLHSLRQVGARILISASVLWNAVEEILPVLQEEDVAVFVVGDDGTMESSRNLNNKIRAASDEPLPLSLRAHVTLKTPSVYIYTSGTTGLPKAAIITHNRLLLIIIFSSRYGLSSDDIIYTTLPLYHSAGSLIGIGGCISLGATVVLRQKFSVSHFWDDCRRYNVTVIQYIGEVLRYLCSAPKRSNDRDHRVRIAMGNGARANVWKEFLNRFGNIHVCEFYGSTEGNVGFVNYVGKIGASGRACFFTRKMMPFHLVKYDVDQEAPVRDANGHCIEVAKGVTGLLIAKITSKIPFVGYAGNKSLTAKRHLRDVFNKGDLYFNSGDLMLLDKDNFIYFQDRIGDTFRWKGENVSTSEVADILLMLDFVQEVCVYGVTVPEHEGRIGMAAILLQSGRDFDGAQLYEHVTTHLPSYAQPRFVRERLIIETTGTFKYYKVTLMKEGFDPAAMQDPLYFLDSQKRSYIRMEEGIYNSINTGQIRL